MKTENWWDYLKFRGRFKEPCGYCSSHWAEFTYLPTLGKYKVRCVDPEGDGNPCDRIGDLLLSIKAIESQLSEEWIGFGNPEKLRISHVSEMDDYKRKTGDLLIDGDEIQTFAYLLDIGSPKQIWEKVDLK